jgi:Cellulose binding domain/Glycosyl hydrolases family 18
MSRSRRYRRRPLPLFLSLAGGVTIATAAGVIAHGSGGAQTFRTAADSGGALTASYQTVTSWGTGYTGQYTITNGGAAAVSGWTLSFQLPAGTRLSSLWNGSPSVSGGTVTVHADSWDSRIAPGSSQSVGFVTASSGQAGSPAGCLINGASCQGGGPAPTSSPTASASPTPSAPTSSPAPTPSSPAPSTPPPTSPSPAPSTPGAPAAGTAGFAPYVDTSLFPPFSLTGAAQQTGVKQFNLAFVVSGGGGCTPEWGGVTALGSDPVAAQLSALRAMGGDVRISFGGANGSELALTCTSASQLQAAYQQVISTYGVDKLDFDIEGAAIANAAANSRRDQALAALQAQDKGLQISFTLPVLPSGLTTDGVSVLTGAVQAGVQISAVNVMAMDYGDGAAPNPAGQMGTFAIDAATATDAQVASVMGISDDAAWPKIAVTPMIGVNDTSSEVFTVANAQQLVAFAQSKHLAWLSMWSAARDQQCPGGAQPSAEPTCSSIAQSPDAFMTALGAF